MVQIEFEKPHSEVCKKLALLNMKSRKGTPLESGKSVDEIAKGIETISNTDGYQILTASDDNGNLVGWMCYYVAFPLMTFISGFHPVVAERPDSENIALKLIEASKSELVRQNRSRLEIELVFPSEAHRAYSTELVDWYKMSGFKFAAEEIHMRSDLNSVELPVLFLPKAYNLRRFSEVPFDRIEGSAFRTLKDSKEGLFLSLSQPEQEVTIRYWFDKSRPYIEDSSLLLEKEEEIVGFVITRIDDDGKPDLGPVGLVPEARRKGLGSFLLVEVLKSLKDSSSSLVYLDTTITNNPAQRLYRKYGFEDVYYKQFYYWSP
jgi:ribosomal protein S18 acetylase RimI-like enzyme